MNLLCRVGLHKWSEPQRKSFTSVDESEWLFEEYWCQSCGKHDVKTTQIQPSPYKVNRRG